MAIRGKVKFLRDTKQIKSTKYEIQIHKPTSFSVAVTITFTHTTVFRILAILSCPSAWDDETSTTAKELWRNSEHFMESYTPRFDVDGSILKMYTSIKDSLNMKFGPYP